MRIFCAAEGAFGLRKAIRRHFNGSTRRMRYGNENTAISWI